MIRQQLFIGAALLAGVAIGFFVQPESERAPETETTVAPTAAIENVGESASLAALRARIRELEAKLAATQNEEEAIVSNAVARLAEQRENRPPEGPRPNRLEEMKKNDPARYAQMTNWFAKMRQDRKSRQAAKADFLASVNTSRMSSSDKKTHDAYQELLARREEIEEKMHSSDITEDERHELMKEMRDISREMRRLGDSERQVLLGEVAHAIGLEGDAATELVETVRDVVEVTDSRIGGGPGGPPPPDAPTPSGGMPPGGPQ